jgi:uncharacterized membrane protein YgdD (TMEM256/DUF423 family)
MNKTFIKVAALSGALAVILGAFATHSLKEKFTADVLQIFETAVRYQFYHGFALLAVGILYKDFQSKCLKWSGNLFIAGQILFSGSLYILCYTKYAELKMNWLGAVTPFGGAAFIAGWILLFAAMLKKD